MGNPGGLAPPLYMHSSVQGSIQGRLREGSLETEWEQRVVSIFRSQVSEALSLPAWLSRHATDSVTETSGVGAPGKQLHDLHTTERTALISNLGCSSPGTASTHGLARRRQQPGRLAGLPGHAEAAVLGPHWCEVLRRWAWCGATMHMMLWRGCWVRSGAT